MAGPKGLVIEKADLIRMRDAGMTYAQADEALGVGKGNVRYHALKLGVTGWKSARGRDVGHRKASSKPVKVERDRRRPGRVSVSLPTPPACLDGFVKAVVNVSDDA